MIGPDDHRLDIPTRLLSKLSLPDELVDRLKDDHTSLHINLSGGVDSQVLIPILLRLHHQHGWRAAVELVHVDLGRMEWPYTLEYVELLADSYALPLHILRPPAGDLIDKIADRIATVDGSSPAFPSVQYRYCTSYKSSSYDKWARNKYPQDHTGYCVLGLRWDESHQRSSKIALQYRQKASAPTRNRQIWTLNPILPLTKPECFEVIGYTMVELHRLSVEVQNLRQAHRGEAPPRLLRRIVEHIYENAPELPPTYTMGISRHSCSSCILASSGELLNASHLRPNIHRLLVAMELDNGYAWREGFWLADLRPDLLSLQQKQRLERLKRARGETTIKLPTKADFEVIQPCLL